MARKVLSVSVVKLQCRKGLLSRCLLHIFRGFLCSGVVSSLIKTFSVESGIWAAWGPTHRRGQHVLCK